MFSVYDADGSGQMSISELSSLLQDLGSSDMTSRGDLDRIFSLVDADGSGTVSFEEFARFWTSTSANISEDGTGPPLPRRKLTMIHPGVYLSVQQQRAPSSALPTFSFTLECTQLISVDVRIDFSDTRNLEIEALAPSISLTGARPDAVGTATIMGAAPFHRYELLTLAVLDPLEPWFLRYETTLRVRPPPTDDPGLLSFLSKLKAKDDQAIQDNLHSIQSVLRSSPALDFASSPADRIVSCLGGTPFLDPEFPPLLSSLVPPALEASAAAAGGDSLLLFAGGIHPSDIQQGCLGNCWLMSSLAALCENPALVEALFADGKVSASGIYRMRLCLGGVWTVLTLDDFFPCFPGAGPVFSRNAGQGIWAPLVEKACAKAYGSYMSLRGGFCVDGLMDLTGCPTYLHMISSESVRAAIRSGEFWEMLVANLDKGNLVCASTPGEVRGAAPAPGGGGPHGLVPGHAYTILHAVEVSGNLLLNIRNPWGAFEWTGDWGDSSKSWSDKIKRTIAEKTGMAFEDVVKDDDGCFWMAFGDWIRHFASVSVCHVKPAGGGEWTAVREKLVFSDAGGEGGGELSAPLRTEARKLFLTEPTEVVFAVHSRDARSDANCKFRHRLSGDYAPVGVSVLKKAGGVGGVGGGGSKRVGAGGYTLAAHAGVCKERQVQTASVLLDAGEYVVVPLESMREAVDAIFDRYDRNCDGVLDLQEFSRLVEDMVGEDNRSNTRKKNSAKLMLGWKDEVGAMTKTRLKDACARAFLNRSDGEQMAAVAGLLEACGYAEEDEEEGGVGSPFVLREQQVGVLTVHASKKGVKLSNGGRNSVALGDAMDLPVRLFGEEQHAEDYGFRSYCLGNGENGVSIGILNVKKVGLYVKVDCSDSRNCRSHRGDLCYSVRIQPGQFVVMHHLTPRRVDADWAWTFQCQVK